MNEFERLFGQRESLRLLQSIEFAVWLNAGLLLIVVAVLLFGVVKRYRAKREQEPDWNEIVEKAYEAGQYERALQALATYELFSPRSASIKFWQGRCHFQQESWTKAAEKFEACVRL